MLFYTLRLQTPALDGADFNFRNDRMSSYVGRFDVSENFKIHHSTFDIQSCPPPTSLPAAGRPPEGGRLLELRVRKDFGGKIFSPFSSRREGPGERGGCVDELRN
jgi:hypothetical protein